tara:strand:- start:34 stop:216 length:183 start_codon:yes stop_codon:yes gene_type:complete
MKKNKKLFDLVNDMSVMLLQLSYFVIEADNNDDAMDLLEHISETQMKIFNIVYDKDTGKE